MKNYIKRKITDYPENSKFSKEEWSQYIDVIAYKLGNFIITFNMVENSIFELVADLFIIKLDVPDESIYAMLSELSFSQKVKAFDTQVKIFSEDSKNKEKINKILREIVKELEDLGKIRNNYVHANWFDSEESMERRLIKIKTKVEDKGIYNYFLEIKPLEIEQNEERLNKLDNKITELDKLLEL